MTKRQPARSIFARSSVGGFSSSLVICMSIQSARRSRQAYHSIALAPVLKRFRVARKICAKAWTRATPIVPLEVGRRRVPLWNRSCTILETVGENTMTGAVHQSMESDRSLLEGSAASETEAGVERPEDGA